MDDDDSAQRDPLLGPAPGARVVHSAAEARPKLVGVWELVTAEYREEKSDATSLPLATAFRKKGNTEIGEVVEYLGENPRGTLMYSSNGFMSVQLMNTFRPDFHMNDRLSGTSEEVRAAFEGYHAYFGRYHVEDGCVLHHIEGCTFPNMIGTSQRRFYELRLGQQPEQADAAAASGSSGAFARRSTPGKQGPASDAGGTEVAQPSASQDWRDELVLRTAPMMMRGENAVGYLVWRRACGPLGPDENFPGRGHQPPSDFYTEQASVSLLYRLVYMLAALSVMIAALWPMLTSSEGGSSGACHAQDL